MLAIAHCDPGPEVLDLTRGLALWVLLRWRQGPGDWLELRAGEGVGVLQASGEPCLSAYARQLLECNLRPLLPEGRCLELVVVIPQGRRLAERTSNAAFGVVDGLALIGTQAEVQRSAAPDQLGLALAELRERCGAEDFGGALVLVIGANGLDLAQQLGVPPKLLLKAGTNAIGHFEFSLENAAPASLVASRAIFRASLLGCNHRRASLLQSISDRQSHHVNLEPLKK